MYQINYHFFLNFQLLHPVGKTIIMSSLGSRQLDFFDLDFVFIIFRGGGGEIMKRFPDSIKCHAMMNMGMRLWMQKN